jgi:hypothetical protein
MMLGGVEQLSNIGTARNRIGGMALNQLNRYCNNYHTGYGSGSSIVAQSGSVFGSGFKLKQNFQRQFFCLKWKFEV